uniref:hypothetical protein n=1 Tax=Capnocytophaga sputigena TaxID=1019 RepID=UPI0028D12552
MKKIAIIISFFLISCKKDTVSNNDLYPYNWKIQSIIINDIEQELDYCNDQEYISFGNEGFIHNKYEFKEEYGKKTCKLYVVSGLYKAVRNKIEFKTEEGNFSYTATLHKDQLTISGKEKDKKGNEYTFSKTYIKLLLSGKNQESIRSAAQV